MPRDSAMQSRNTIAVCRVDSFKTTPIIGAIVCAGLRHEAGMAGTTARQEAEKILAELPDRMSDVIKPFAPTAQSIQLWCRARSRGATRNWRPSSQTRR